MEYVGRNGARVGHLELMEPSDKTQYVADWEFEHVRTNIFSWRIWFLFIPFSHDVWIYHVYRSVIWVHSMNSTRVRMALCRFASCTVNCRRKISVFRNTFVMIFCVALISMRMDIWIFMSFYAWYIVDFWNFFQWNQVHSLLSCRLIDWLIDDPLIDWLIDWCTGLLLHCFPAFLDWTGG